MGLFVEFDALDLGFPEEVSGGDGKIGYESVFVDYSEACEAFVETFLDIATTLVPVDTGYLRSTINAETDGYSYCMAEATADYAQYVEYGTFRMEAQPYFTPALEEAMKIFNQLANEAVNIAQEELEAILSGMMEASMVAMGGGQTFGSFLGGLGLFIGLGILLFPLLVNLYGILDSTFGALTKGSSSGGLLPEIIIT